jgi:hypothetical protein
MTQATKHGAQLSPRSCAHKQINLAFQPKGQSMAFTKGPLKGRSTSEHGTRIWTSARVTFYIEVEPKLWRKIKSPEGWIKRAGYDFRFVSFTCFDPTKFGLTPKWYDEMEGKLMLIRRLGPVARKPPPRPIPVAAWAHVKPSIV